MAHDDLAPTDDEARAFARGEKTTVPTELLNRLEAKINKLQAVADAADKYIRQQIAGLPSNRLLHAYYDARDAE